MLPRILCVTRAFPPAIGGMERLSDAFTRALAQKTTVVLLANRSGKMALPFFFPWAALRLHQLASRVDVIHLGDPLLTALIPAIPKPRKPVVAVTVHGLDIVYANPVYQALIRRNLPRVRLALCISRFVEREFRMRFPSVRTLVVTPGHAMEDRPRREPPLSRHDLEQRIGAHFGSSPLLLIVARLVPRKGVAWFVEHVLPHISDAHLLVIGSGPEEHNIRAAAARARTHHRLTIAGVVNAETLRAAYRVADLLVMPNIPIPGDMEGFGLVALEAAAVGLPVVAADLEGIPDAVVPGDTGVLVPPQDGSAWTQTIARLLGDAEERRRLQAGAPRVVRERFAWPHRAERVLSALAELSARANTSPLKI